MFTIDLSKLHQMVLKIEKHEFEEKEIKLDGDNKELDKFNYVQIKRQGLMHGTEH